MAEHKVIYRNTSTPKDNYYSVNTLMKEITHEFKVELAKKISEEKVHESDWRLVASRLLPEFTNDDISEIRAKHPDNPAFGVLEKWERKERSTLRVLLKVCEDLELPHVVKYIHHITSCKYFCFKQCIHKITCSKYFKVSFKSSSNRSLHVCTEFYKPLPSDHL